MVKSFRNIISENRLYLSLVLVFLVSGFVLWMLYPKGFFVEFFAVERNIPLDHAFAFITKLGEEPVYAVATIVLLFSKFKDAIFIPLLGLFATVASAGLKAIFGMPRPAYVYWVEVDQGILHGADGVLALNAMNSFPSGHTLSAFLFYGFLAFLLPKKRWALLLFIIAALTGFSRIILFQHFLADVIAGALVGTISAMLFYWIRCRISDNPAKWYNRSLIKLQKPVV